MKKQNHAVLAFVVALALALLPGNDADAASKPPRQFMDEFHNALLSVMRDGTLDYNSRYNRLITTVEETFHLPAMTQMSSGSFWTDAAPTHRQILVNAFTRYAVSLFARNFSGDGIKGFKTVRERTGPQNTVLVDALLVRKNGDGIDLTYVLRPYAGSWRVVDVVLDRGISELALRRSEFSHSLASGGMTALADTLNQKSDELAMASQ